MKKTEIILIILAITGLILKKFHIPGHATLITLSILILTVVYMVFSFALFNQIRLRDIFKKSSYQHTNVWRIIGSVCTGFALGATTASILFGLQHYPGTQTMLISGIFQLTPVALLVLIKALQRKSGFYTGILYRVIPALIIAIVLWLYPGMV